MRSARKAIENIIFINPLIYALQDKVEEEQERVISDLVSPAEKVVERLIALDNRRIDLCNLNVLYGLIKKELGDGFVVLTACVYSGAESELFKVALNAAESVGYDAERINAEFGYLFKMLKRPRGKKIKRIKGLAVSEMRLRA